MARPYLRHTAKIEGDFVVFLIGVHLHKPWRIPTVMRVGRAMIAMIKELEANPALGYLGKEEWPGRTTIQVQYWRSRDQLMAYARSRDATHLPAWRDFNTLIAKTDVVGIWHETYNIRAGDYECIYGNMPLFGLAKATSQVPIEGRLETAKGRMNVSDGTDAPDGVAVDV